MTALGIKVSNTAIRYAILEKSEFGTIVFRNLNDNRLLFPRDLMTDSKKLVWFFDEFNRLIDIHQDICKIVVKLPESGHTETNAIRLSHYLDAVVFLVAARHNPPIACMGVQYRALHTSSSEVRDFVCSKGIPKTPHYWNAAMGDAIAAALAGLE